MEAKSAAGMVHVKALHLRVELVVEKFCLLQNTPLYEGILGHWLGMLD